MRCASSFGHAGGDKLAEARYRAPPWPRAVSTSSSTAVDRRDAGAVVLDRRRPDPCVRSARAQEPDDAVEQQVLHRGVELELQLAGDLVVERVDRAR